MGRPSVCLREEYGEKTGMDLTWLKEKHVKRQRLVVVFYVELLNGSAYCVTKQANRSAGSCRGGTVWMTCWFCRASLSPHAISTSLRKADSF
mmetsp:Transcript_34456/g.68152  ORF Transcript_34456/g.68152 Transcript_34456/m.68152 type:complete len:92 (+) Transcript_34456:1508-1783(+)